jgi:hypothetical protein
VANQSKIDNRKSTIGLALLLAAGCVAPRRTTAPPADPVTLDDAAFMHYLAAVPTVTVAEGSRAVLVLVGPTPNWPSYEAQADRLRQFGAVRDEWQLRPDQTLDHGTLAFMLVAACDVPRGVNERLADATGLGDRRYALKTCIDRQLLPYHLPQDPVAGGELVAALAKAENLPLRSTVKTP